MKSARLSGCAEVSKKRAGGIVTAGALVAVAALTASTSSVKAATEYTSGANTYGQIGNGASGAGTASNSVSSPTLVNTLDSGVTITAEGGAHSLAVDNGRLYGWGLTAYGATGDGTMTGAATSENTPQVTPLSGGITALSAGLYGSVAIANGAVYTFGLNINGSGGYGTNTTYAVPTLVTALSSGVTAIASGTQTNLAIQRGALYSFGFGGNGQLGNGVDAVTSTTYNASSPFSVPGFTSGVTAIAEGGYHSLAVMNGAAYAFGLNEYGALGGATENEGYDPTAEYTTPQPVTGLIAGVTQVAAGEYHSLALANGVVFAFGENNDGQLGNGTTTDSPIAIPVVIPDLNPITKIVAGAYSSYALDADGTIWVWGDNTFGQLGLGTSTTDYTTPQQLIAPAGYLFTDVSSGAVANTVSFLEAPIPEPVSIGLVSLIALPMLRRSRRV